MKTILNLFLSAMLVAVVAFNANAQALDMYVGSPNILPNPATYPGNMTASFVMQAELLPHTLSSNDVDANWAQLTVSFVGLQGSASLLPVGTGADLFTWIYNPTLNTYYGLSKDVTMDPDINYFFTFPNMPIIQANTSPNAAGFAVDLTPPGDLLASQSIDDNASIYQPTPLPVTLVSFTAKKEGSIALLNWATTEETNSDYFEIQHSVSGKEWEAVGQVASSGESKVLKNYSFSHANPVHGQNLYRLKMVDKDETFAYSSIRSLKFEGAGADLSIYPNPIVNQLFIRDASQVTQVLINDLNGRTVHQSGSTATGFIDVKGLSAGMYIVRVSRSNGLVSSHKVVVSR